MPLSVAGVTTAPSEIPISTRRMRIGSVGIVIGRPASEAQATARIEPDSQPAGTPVSPSVSPPATANASVSATSRNILVRSMDDGADKVLRLVERDQCRARALPSNALSSYLSCGG